MRWHRRRQATKRSAKVTSALRVAGATALLLCCSSSPMSNIDSSSRLESETVSPPTNGMFFMGQDTKGG